VRLAALRLQIPIEKKPKKTENSGSKEHIFLGAWAQIQDSWVFSSSA
jgi:hypothetical protein